MIGYYLQENPLFDYFTVRETLSYYKSLKNQKNLLKVFVKNLKLKNIQINIVLIYQQENISVKFENY